MTQPPLVIPSDVEVAQAGKSLLATGSALYTLASDDFEVLRITFVFCAGSAMQRVPFSASAAAVMSRVPSLSRLAVDVATNALRCCAEPARKTKLTQFLLKAFRIQKQLCLKRK